MMVIGVLILSDPLYRLVMAVVERSVESRSLPAHLLLQEVLGCWYLVVHLCVVYAIFPVHWVDRRGS